MAISDNEEGEWDHNLDDETKGNQQWEKQYTITILLNIGRIVQEITPTNNPTTSISEPIRYYMEMFHSHVIGPSKLDEPTTNPFRLTKVVLMEFDDLIINLVDYDE